MNILIAGATGFIGQHVAEAFYRSDNQVGILYRNGSVAKIHNLPSEICVYHISENPSPEEIESAVREASPECLIHLAGNTYDESTIFGRNQTLQANFLLGWNLLNAVLENSVPYFINTGTYWSYGKNHTEPNTLYALLKSEFQRILEFHASQDKLKVLTLVLYDVYGPNDPRNKILSILFDAIRNNSLVEMTSGEQQLDLVYIDDVAQGYVAGVHLLKEVSFPNMSQYALRTGELHSLRSIVDSISSVTGKVVNVEWGRKPYLKHQIFRPIQSIPILPNWEPRDLTTGLMDMARKEFA